MTTYTGTPKATPRRWLLLAAGGVAVALAVGTSVGAWRLTQNGQVSQVVAVRHEQPPVQEVVDLRSVAPTTATTFTDQQARDAAESARRGLAAPVTPTGQRSLDLTRITPGAP